MAQPGPRPQATSVKRLRGNPGKRPLNDAEPDIPAEMPDCPDHLDEIGKAEWKRLTELLEGRGLITKADRAVMTVYCETWSIQVQAAKNLHVFGPIMVSKPNNIPYQSPYLGIVNTSTRTLAKLAAELGLSPSSRSRVTAVGKQKAPDGKGRFFKVAG